MTHRSICPTLLLTLVGVLHAGEFQAGAAVCDITPPIGYPLWGYAHRHDAPSTAVHDPLFARAVVFGNDQLVAIIALDLGRPPHREGVARIRAALAPDGIATLLLCASHTHHGPVLELDDWPNAERPWTRDLESQLIAVIRAARRQRQPARWGAATASIPFNRNRQSKRPDAVTDRDLAVVRLETPAGRVIATLVNFAAHPTMFDGKSNAFSADYPGPLCAAVAAATDNAPCLFLQGWSGDLSANAPGPATPGAFGQALAAETLKLAATIRCPSRPGVWQSRTESMRFPCVLELKNPFVRLGLGRAFFPALVAAYEREYADGVRPELTAGVLDGELGIAAGSCELFCGHALHLKRRARLPTLLTVGCCNGYHQYLPTADATAEGGYGTQPPVALAPPGSGEAVGDRLLLMLARCRGLLPDPPQGSP